MSAWLSSGPEYIPICVLCCMTPTTVNGEPFTRSCFPTGSSAPKMSFARTFPRKMTRRFSRSSSGPKKRPPAFG